MLLGNNHPGIIFAEVITIKILFALAKPSVIADCWGEFWGLLRLVILYTKKLLLYCLSELKKYVRNDGSAEKSVKLILFQGYNDING